MIGHPPPCYYNRLKCRKKIKESPIQCAVPQLPIRLRLHFPEMAIARQKNNVVFPFAMRLQCDRWKYLFRRRLKRKKKNIRNEGRTCNCIDFRWILFSYPVSIGAHFYCAYPHHHPLLPFAFFRLGTPALSVDMASSSFSFFFWSFLSPKIAFQIFEDKIVNERYKMNRKMNDFPLFMSVLFFSPKFAK